MRGCERCGKRATARCSDNKMLLLLLWRQMSPSEREGRTTDSESVRWVAGGDQVGYKLEWLG